MNAIANRQFRLAARPLGPAQGQRLEPGRRERVRDPGDGECLVRIAYISLDPAMRGWMNEGKSYVPPVGIGEVMRAYAAGEVVAFNNPKFPLGSRVAGVCGVQQYVISDGKAARLVDARLAPLPTHLSVLGMTGMTAYFGLLDVGAAKDGDTVVGCMQALASVLDGLPRGFDALVFTSGGPIAALAQEMLRIADSDGFRLSWGLVNCGVTKRVRGRDGVRLSTLNGHAHFEGEHAGLVTYR